MKRPKRGMLTEKTFIQSIYSVECPHCKTKLTGGIYKSIDRLFCRCCGEVIILDWQAPILSHREGDGDAM